MKIAVIITGQLRFRDIKHLQNFRQKLGVHDTFISSTTKYKSYALKLTSLDKCILMNETEMKVKTNNMFQWYHLDNVMRKFSKTLYNYDIIIKIRTDINCPNIDKLKSLEILPETIYCCTDILFYGRASHFIKTFHFFWNNIISEYMGSVASYKKINYRNIIDSNGPLYHNQEMGARFTWLIVPRFIFSDNFDTFKKNIQKNLPYLDRLNVNEAEYNDLINYRRLTGIFSSEQTFCLHCFNSGRVENSKLPIQLLGGRHQWT
tara:strand:+ start:1108 stop:1893 length:786 start_codon:yes stop_codon:yes gene_type:complete